MKTSAYLCAVVLSSSVAAACAASDADPIPPEEATQGTQPNLPPPSGSSGASGASGSSGASGTPGTSGTSGSPAPGPKAPDAVCYGASPLQFIHCDGSSTTRELTTGIYPASVVSTYACASGEVARETALEFDPPAGAVTVTLEVTDGSNADLDLIVLEGYCYASSKCMNQASGSDVAGVTAGAGNETVTFTAAAGKKYYLVVDGKTAVPAKFRISVVCS